jgi:hypothetical protein
MLNRSQLASAHHRLPTDEQGLVKKLNDLDNEKRAVLVAPQVHACLSTMRALSRRALGRTPRTAATEPAEALRASQAKSAAPEYERGASKQRCAWRTLAARLGCKPRSEHRRSECVAASVEGARRQSSRVRGRQRAEEGIAPSVHGCVHVDRCVDVRGVHAPAAHSLPGLDVESIEKTVERGQKTKCIHALRRLKRVLRTEHRSRHAQQAAIVKSVEVLHSEYSAPAHHAFLQENKRKVREDVQRVAAVWKSFLTVLQKKREGMAHRLSNMDFERPRLLNSMLASVSCAARLRAPPRLTFAVVRRGHRELLQAREERG